MQLTVLFTLLPLLAHSALAVPTHPHDEAHKQIVPARNTIGEEMTEFLKHFKLNLAQASSASSSSSAARSSTTGISASASKSSSVSAVSSANPSTTSAISSAKSSTSSVVTSAKSTTTSTTSSVKPSSSSTSSATKASSSSSASSASKISSSASKAGSTSSSSHASSSTSSTSTKATSSSSAKTSSVSSVVKSSSISSAAKSASTSASAAKAAVTTSSSRATTTVSSSSSIKSTTTPSSSSIKATTTSTPTSIRSSTTSSAFKSSTSSSSTSRSTTVVSSSKVSLSTSSKVSLSTSSTFTTTSSASSSTASAFARGLGLNSNGYSELSEFTGLGWYYNWALSAFETTANVEYVPMVWGSGSIPSVASATFPSSTKYILGFNEPDMSSSVGGSNLNATYAATLHQNWTSQLKQDLKIGAPAVARGSTTWFSNWVTACAGKCTFDFVPIHFYGDNAQDMISYIKTFPAQGKPIWVTEWSCMDYSSGYVCTASEVESFMATVIDWARTTEGQSYVQRWAWFGAFPDQSSSSWGMENSDGSPNALAKYYLTL